MRVAVTGAAGFIGSHLCERLLSAGHEVTGVDAFTRFYGRETKEANIARLLRAPGFRLAERNLLAPGLVDALSGAGAVCHLAGRPGVRSGAESLFQRGNVATTEAVLRAAAEAGVARVLLASSSSVYAASPNALHEDGALAPRSGYGRSKLRAERVAARLAAGLGLELVTLRYFTVYGPRQRPDMAFARFVRAAYSGEPMPLFGRAQARDFTYVGDAAEATVLALERGRPGGVYNVSGGERVPLSRALELAVRALGRRAPTVLAPAHPGEHSSTLADLTRARRELGYEPRIGIAEGIGRQVAHAMASACAS
jgi:UDP-glucuronate 4-epimerase